MENNFINSHINSTLHGTYEPPNNENLSENKNSPPKPSKKFIGVIILAVVALMLISSSMITVNKDEYALVKQFGKLETIYDTAGLHFKIPFVQSVEKMPSNVMLYDMPASDVLTKDKKAMIVDDYVLWQIVDPTKFYKTLNSLNEGERRIDTIVYNALKNYISSMDQSSVIAGRSSGISNELLPGMKTSFDSYGIELKSIEIKRLDLPDDNKESVYSRMISERSQMAASYTAEGNEQAQIIRNDTDKQKAIIISEAQATAEQTMAEGESEYMKILADAYSTSERLDFYQFMRQLDSIKITMSGDNKTLVLPIDSPITKILMGY